MGERAGALVAKAKVVFSTAWARGPQRAFLLLAGVVVLLVGLVGWFVVAGNDDDTATETAGTGEDAATETTTTVATTTTAPTTTTTTLPPTTTTTLSEEEQAEQEVIDAYEAAVEVQQDAFAEPVDPDHPELEEHLVGGALNESRNTLETMVANGWASRFPADPVMDIDIEVDRFDEVDGAEVAHLSVCVVTNEETYWVENGAAVPHLQGLRTGELEVEMRKVDGVWKAADAPPHEAEEGRTGCALD